MRYDSSSIFVMIKRLLIGYGLLLTLAAGGLAFATIFGFVAGAIQVGGEGAPEPESARTWMHLGWFFGVVVALVGVVVKLRGRPGSETSREVSDAAGKDSQSSHKGRHHGFWTSSAMGGCAGAVLGGVLGTTFVLLWFSLAYSPFAPQEWSASVSTRRQRVHASHREEPVATTNHPVALLAFGIPLALGTIAGAVLGSVTGVQDVN